MHHQLKAFPAWIESLPAEQQPRERMRFILRYAAVLGTPKGSISALSEAIGYAATSLPNAVTGGVYDNGLPVTVIKGIEELVGAGAIPREMMNPRIYGEE